MDQMRIRELENRYATRTRRISEITDPSGTYTVGPKRPGSHDPVQTHYQQDNVVYEKVPVRRSVEAMAPPYSTKDNHPVLHAKQQRSPMIDPPLSKPNPRYEAAYGEEPPCQSPPPPMRRLVSPQLVYNNQLSPQVVHSPQSTASGPPNRSRPSPQYVPHPINWEGR